MTISYFFAFAWGLCVLLSLVGWGDAVRYVLFRSQAQDWGQKAAWGVALSIFVGGILNLAERISGGVVLIYLATGLLWWIVSTVRAKRQMPKALFHWAIPKPRTIVLAAAGLLVFSISPLFKHVQGIGRREAVAVPYTASAEHDPWLARILPLRC